MCHELKRNSGLMRTKLVYFLVINHKAKIGKVSHNFNVYRVH